MRITMDSAGRIVVPKSIREQSHLKAGSPLEISYRGGAVVLEPVSLEVELVREGQVLVAKPVNEIVPLDTEVVDRTLDSVRERQL